MHEPIRERAHARGGAAHLRLLALGQLGAKAAATALHWSQATCWMLIGLDMGDAKLLRSPEGSTEPSEIAGFRPHRGDLAGIGLVAGAAYCITHGAVRSAMDEPARWEPCGIAVSHDKLLRVLHVPSGMLSAPATATATHGFRASRIDSPLAVRRSGLLVFPQQFGQPRDSARVFVDASSGHI